MNEALQQMLVEQACRDLVLRAAQHADAHEPAAFAALFTPDAELLRPNAAPLLGRDAIQSAYAQRAPDRLTRHLVTNTLVHITSPTQASARSYVLLWAGSHKDALSERGRPAMGSQIVGEFDDAFELTPEGWRISRREARFVLHSV